MNKQKQNININQAGSSARTPEHEQAVRLMTYALMADTPDAWLWASKIWHDRLTERERVCIAFASLRSLDFETAELVMEAVLAGCETPLPPLFTCADEAAFWAAWAEYRDVKACTLAGFNRLSHGDQAAFLEHVQGRAAA